MKNLPDGVRIEAGPGGLARLAITASMGEALIYTHGAHVAHFQPRGAKPVLWMSKASLFVAGAPGEAIRGGVPICFPWFGPKAGEAGAPIHGVARLFTWDIESVAMQPDERIRVILNLRSNDDTRRIIARDFDLTFTVAVGATLSMELTVRNTDREPLRVEEALHTYFAVSDVRQIAVTGLENAPYIDKVGAAARKVQDADSLRVTAETNRVYLGHPNSVTLHDPGWGRRIVVKKAGSMTTVVWNPWIDKAKAMPDFGDDEWPEMLCIETVNAVDDALLLPPGESHGMAADIEVHADR